MRVEVRNLLLGVLGLLVLESGLQLWGCGRSSDTPSSPVEAPASPSEPAKTPEPVAEAPKSKPKSKPKPKAAAGWKVAIRRVGKIPNMPEMPIRRVDGSPCAMEIEGDKIRYFSDKRLARFEMGPISPVVVRHRASGTLLKPFGSAADTTECGGSSSFRKSVIRFSALDAKHGPDDYEVAFSDALPLEAPKGPVWWVYANSGVEVTIPATPKLKGMATVNVTGRALGKDKEGWRLRLGKKEAPLTIVEGRLSGKLAIKMRGKPVKVRVLSGRGVPNILLETITLTIGDKKHELLTPPTQ